MPSLDSINRYIKEQDLVKEREIRGEFPSSPCPCAENSHDLWEMDAQGAIKVSSLECQAMVNVKDTLSLTHCMAFPVQVAHERCQPSKVHYKWALRLAFEEIGLPKGIQVDKDSVFYENNTKSPFPSPLHLWLTALGVQLCHIEVPPPKKQARVERTHQTMQRQVFNGKHHNNWGSLFKNCNERRHRLNTSLGVRTLANKAPWQVRPEAKHSGRHFQTAQEAQLLDPARIHSLLASGTWYRIVSMGKMISLGGKRYYLKKAQPKSQVCITFDDKICQFVFRDVNEQVVAQLPPKGISIAELSGADQEQLNKFKENIFKCVDFPEFNY
jgi:hypothetical protein